MSTVPNIGLGAILDIAYNKEHIGKGEASTRKIFLWKDGFLYEMLSDGTLEPYSAPPYLKKSGLELSVNGGKGLAV